jgi:primosomal protein N' (replication factor Y)
VSGRAGRRDKPGLVVIQTSGPDHPLLQTILRHNYKEFFATQLADRQQHDYPPFTRLIEITIKHTDKKTCKTAADTLADQLRDNLSFIPILGPGEPAISKIRNQYLMNILLKLPRGKYDLAAIKKTITTFTTQLTIEKQFRSVRITVDVDPM